MTNKKILYPSIVIMLLLLMSQSDTYALALSEIKLNSSLNQQLSATIELLSATQTELDSLNTFISTSKSKSAGSGGYWPQLKVELVRMEKGNSYLKITSKDNMREPLFNFLLELVWSGGRIQREYSLLLNPPH